MYQKSCLRQNDERKDNIFDMQFSLPNIAHEKRQKYMFFSSFGPASKVPKLTHYGMV